MIKEYINIRKERKYNGTKKEGNVLGHGSITSTEVYAKVALEKKIEAVNLFNGVFD